MRLPCSLLAALSLALLPGPSGLSADPAPGLPPGVHPLSPELAKHMDELVHAAEEYRGLRLARPVPYGALDEQGLRARVAEEKGGHLARDRHSLEVSLQAFGLLPEGADLEKIQRDLFVQQIAAYYDPERKYLVMVDHPGKNGTEALAQAFGPEMARRAEEGVLVHELTHAIDDQHFHLGKTAEDNPLADGSAAYLGLVEGDATLVMFDYIAGQRIETVPGFGRMMRELLSDPGQLAALLPDLPGSAGLTDTPAWFRDRLLFSYLQGFSFCLDVEHAGGQRLLDHAFSQDPPRSTEQILHPEKWYGRRDGPIRLAWPDLTAVLPGWKKAAEGELGEEGIGILLRTVEKDASRAATAAAGWGGDRFAVYEKNGHRLLLWLTEWDTGADAAEFQETAAKLAQGNAGWKMTRPAPTRLVLTRGDLSPEPEGPVAAALAAVRAERPASRDLDLAALGIAPRPAQAEAKAPPGQAEQEKEGGEISADGRTYTDARHRFTLQVPGKDWTLSRATDGEHLLWIKHPEKAIIAISERNVGSAPPLDRLGPALASALQKKGSVTLLHSAMIERGATKCYELQSEVTAQNARLHTVERLYARDTYLVTVHAMVPLERWPAREAAVLSILDSFAILPEPLDAEVTSHLSADGSTYSNPELGFSIRLPRGEPGWRWDPKRHAAPVLMASADGEVKLAVHPELLPAASPEVMGRLYENRESARPGRRKLRSGLVQKDGREFYELEYESEEEGLRLREVRRYYRNRDGLVTVFALCRVNAWTAHERAIVEAMDSFTSITAPASPPH